MTTPLKVTPKELRTVAAHLTQHGPCSGLSTSVATGIPSKRCGAALRIVGRICGTIWSGPTRTMQWVLRDDWEERAAAEPERTQTVRAHPQHRYRDPDGETYPTADPHHFDVDWIGRLVYTGPR